jgi:hypothetical protein
MTEEQNMSEQLTDDLQRAFDGIIGDPRPSADLAARARARATTLRRQWMTGGLAAAAVTGALCLPGLALVRDHQAQVGSVGSTVPGQPKTHDLASANARKAAAMAAGAFGSGPTEQTVIKPGAVTSADQVRVNAAKTLLGSGFTVTSTGVAMDAQSGAIVGGAVTFTATAGGGSVGIEWSTVERTRTGTTGAASGSSGSESGTVTSKDGPSGRDGGVSGAALVLGDTEWDVKILQGSPGSAPILATPTAATTFLSQLAAASS